jgi:hypothetical protein
MEKIRGVKGNGARAAEEGRLRVLATVTEQELQPDPTLADVDVGVSVARVLPGAVALRPRNTEPSRSAKLPPARRQLQSDDDSDDESPPVNAKAPLDAKQSQPSSPLIVIRRRLYSRRRG